MRTREHCSGIMHQGIHNTCSIWRRKKADQDLESGLVFDEQEREAISLSHQHATGAIQSNGSIHCLHKGPHMQQSSRLISVLFDCDSTYLLNQGYSSEGQERRYVKAKKQSVAKTVVPACVVPPSFLAKGNREERGGHHAAIWTFLSVKHTEEIKVTQPPLKCASMLGHRLRVVK
jgi:hypothetical protein